MREMFYWHTKRAFRYPDAYWQWFKASSLLLEMSLDGNPDLEYVYKYIYTAGWQMDMQIISLEDFVIFLKSGSTMLEETEYAKNTVSENK